MHGSEEANYKCKTNVLVIVLILFRLDLSQLFSKLFTDHPMILFCSCVGSLSSHLNYSLF